MGATLAQAQGSPTAPSPAGPTAREPLPTDPATIATARALAIAGVQLAESDRCDEAILKLQQAEALHHAPVVLYHLGACHIRLGRLVAGSEILRGMLRDAPPATPNPAVEDARRRATVLLEKIRSDVATLTVLLDAPGDSTPSVKLDGEPLPATMLGIARAIDPGEHTVEAHAVGLSSSVQKLIVGAGQTRVVALSLKPGASRERASSSTDAEVGTTTPLHHAVRRDASAPSFLRRLPAYIAWGIGASALLIGTGYGWSALRGSADLAERCPQRLCPPESQAKLATERTHATVATIAFTVAAAGGVAGTVLYLTSDDPPESPTMARGPQSKPPRASLRLGLSGLALGLSFD
jgi:hypothetical protein